MAVLSSVTTASLPAIDEVSCFSNYAVHSRTLFACVTLCIRVVCGPYNTSCLEHVQESLVCRFSLSQTEASPRGKTAINLPLQRETIQGSRGKQLGKQGEENQGGRGDLGQKVTHMSGNATVGAATSHAN